EEAARMRAIARVRAAIQLFYLGAHERADALLAGCTTEPGCAADPTVQAWLCDARFERSFALGPIPHPSMLNEGIELCRKLGDRRGVITHTANQCVILGCLGAYDQGRSFIERTRGTLKEAGPAFNFIETLWTGTTEALHGDYVRF